MPTVDGDLFERVRAFLESLVHPLRRDIEELRGAIGDVRSKVTIIGQDVSTLKKRAEEEDEDHQRWSDRKWDLLLVVLRPIGIVLIAAGLGFWWESIVRAIRGT